MISTLVYPFVGLALRRKSEAEAAEQPPSVAGGEAPAVA
jgi:hypothetical protein